MALPQLQKQWQINANNAISEGDVDAASAELLFQIKQALTSAAQNPLTVAGSSDSVAAGMDGTDRWADASDVVWSSLGNRSWIVLQNSTGAQLLLACSQLNPERLNAFVSPSGAFAGGSISANPTAVDQFDINQLGGTQWRTNETDATFHTWLSRDGEVCRVVIHRADGEVTTFLRFEAINLPVDGHTNNPTLGVINYDSTPPTETTTLQQNTGFTEKDGTGDVIELQSSLVSAWDINVSQLNFDLGRLADVWDGELSAYEEILYNNVLGSRGPKGASYDLWYQNQSGGVVLTGDTFPNDAANRQFAVFGNIVLPWLGDATTVTGAPSMATYDLYAVTHKQTTGGGGGPTYRMRGFDDTLMTLVYWDSDTVDSSASDYAGPGPVSDAVVVNVTGAA